MMNFYKRIAIIYLLCGKISFYLFDIKLKPNCPISVYSILAQISMLNVRAISFHFFYFVMNNENNKSFNGFLVNKFSRHLLIPSSCWLDHFYIWLINSKGWKSKFLLCIKWAQKFSVPLFDQIFGSWSTLHHTKYIFATLFLSKFIT